MNTYRETAISYMMGKYNVSRETAIDYLVSEEWDIEDACISYEGDKAGGL
jgi:hypothetical protein